MKSIEENVNLKEDNLYQYLVIIYRRKWIVILSIMVALTFSIVFTPEIRPTYRAATTIMIKLPVLRNPMLKDIDIALDEEQIIQQTKIIRSRTLLEKVLKQLQLNKIKLAREKGALEANANLPTSVDELQEAVSVRNIPETNLLEIIFFAESASLAENIVELITENFVKQNLKASEKRKGSNPYVTAELMEPLKEELKEELVKLGLERSLLLRDYTAKHPKVLEINDKIEEVVQTLEEIGSANNVVVNVKVVGKARISEIKPPSKRPQKATVGGLIGFLLGVSFIFLLEHMDTSIKTIEDIRQFMNQPVIGTIPEILTKKEKLFGRGK